MSIFRMIFRIFHEYGCELLRSGTFGEARTALAALFSEFKEGLRIGEVVGASCNVTHTNVRIEVRFAFTELQKLIAILNHVQTAVVTKGTRQQAIRQTPITYANALRLGASQFPKHAESTRTAQSSP